MSDKPQESATTPTREEITADSSDGEVTFAKFTKQAEYICAGKRHSSGRLLKEEDHTMSSSCSKSGDDSPWSGPEIEDSDIESFVASEKRMDEARAGTSTGGETRQGPSGGSNIWDNIHEYSCQDLKQMAEAASHLQPANGNNLEMMYRQSLIDNGHAVPTNSSNRAPLPGHAGLAQPPALAPLLAVPPATRMDHIAQAANELVQVPDPDSTSAPVHHALDDVLANWFHRSGASKTAHHKIITDLARPANLTLLKQVELNPELEQILPAYIKGKDRQWRSLSLSILKTAGPLARAWGELFALQLNSSNGDDSATVHATTASGLQVNITHLEDLIHSLLRAIGFAASQVLL